MLTVSKKIPQTNAKEPNTYLYRSAWSMDIVCEAFLDEKGRIRDKERNL